MAIYHLTAKIGSRAGGHSARAKAQYVLRLGPYAHQPETVAYTASANLPEFASAPTTGAPDPVAYWTAADLYERKNGRLFREVEVALPVELEPDEQRALVHEFVPIVLAGEALPYTLAIHGQDGPNPHCHLLVSERINDGIERPAELWFRRFKRDAPERGGARKTEALDKKSWLLAIREAWANLVNRALERAGFLDRVDHRSLRAQGIERVPQVHVGPGVRRMEARGRETGRGDLAAETDLRNDQLAERVSVRRRIDALDRHESESRERAAQGPRRSSERAPDSPEIAPPELARARSENAESGTSRLPQRVIPDLRSGAPKRAPARQQEGAKTDARASHSAPAEESEIRVRTRVRSSHENEEIEAPQRTSPAPENRDLAIPDGRDRAVRNRPESERDRATSDSPESPDQGSRELSSAPRDPRSPDGAKPTPDAAASHRDRTARAVARQLRAMGCERYEIGLREASTGRFMKREGTPQEVLERLPWLKRMNARGNDIYVRPTRGITGHGLVLLDDLDRTALRKLEHEGRNPAVVVETSPGSFQAWIRVAREAADADRTRIARSLAREYDADPASGHAHPYGRLAGFTNRKPEHRSREGLHPFALLGGASGRVAPDGRALLRDATRTRSESERHPESPHASRIRTSEGPRPDRERETIELYRRELATLLRRTRDISRADFGAAARLARRGFDSETIRAAMRAASPGLERRKAGHVEDYVQRTVAAAMRAQGPQAERGVSSEGQERER